MPGSPGGVTVEGATSPFAPEVPARVAYSLSDLGRSIVPVLRPLAEWADSSCRTSKPPAAPTTRAEEEARADVWAARVLSPEKPPPDSHYVGRAAPPVARPHRRRPSPGEPLHGTRTKHNRPRTPGAGLWPLRWRG
ncbi:winged helix-turn-helix transcriptional regulator [Streptomyces sp. A30]|uniref:winged helix-turn-helix transcriptional regulator n=1 Tax=Streptomyces sp. A30 TaxID=2789273 RepID=UPI00397FD25C